MPIKERELTEARELLGKFEAEMHKPEGIVHLSEALSLLADVREGEESGKAAQIASNIALAYAKKVHREIENLTRELVVHWETVEHWNKVILEFERSGFAIPPDMADARSRLMLKKMSPSERQSLLEKLQAMDRKETP